MENSPPYCCFERMGCPANQCQNCLLIWSSARWWNTIHAATHGFRGTREGDMGLASETWAIWHKTEWANMESNNEWCHAYLGFQMPLIQILHLLSQPIWGLCYRSCSHWQFPFHCQPPFWECPFQDTNENNLDHIQPRWTKILCWYWYSTQSVHQYGLLVTSSPDW